MIVAPIFLLLSVIVPINVSDCPTRGDARSLGTRYANRVLINRRVEDARRCATQLGWRFRVVVRDNSPLPRTLDRRRDRVNATVLEGRVVYVYVG